MTAAEIVQGDLNDPATVVRATSGVYGVYNVQAYLPKDPASEIHARF